MSKLYGAYLSCDINYIGLLDKFYFVVLANSKKQAVEIIYNKILRNDVKEFHGTHFNKNLVDYHSRKNSDVNDPFTEQEIKQQLNSTVKELPKDGTMIHSYYRE